MRGRTTAETVRVGLLVACCGLGCGGRETSRPDEAPGPEVPTADPESILGHPVMLVEGLVLHDVAFDGSQFVAVGQRGAYEAVDEPGLQLGARSLVLRSGDGATWSLAYQAPLGPLLDIEHAEGTWLAVGRGVWGTATFQQSRAAALVISDDGVSFRPGDPPIEDGLSHVIAGESGFIAASYDSIWKTSSGLKWSEHALPAHDYDGSLMGLTRSRGVVLAFNYSELFRSTDDGGTWSRVPQFGESEGIPDTLNAFWDTPTGFAGSTQVPAREHLDVSSSDGLSWTRTERDDADKSGAVLQLVTDGTTTLRRTSRFEAEVELASPVGSWQTVLDGSIHALAQGNGVFVAVGEAGVQVSRDGQAWTAGTIELD